LPVVAAADPQAVADWQAAQQAVEREAEVKAERRAAQANGTPTLNRLTWAFIRDGATEGDRHRWVFSAAANLAEFGCPRTLAHELLTPAGLDSGLTPSDVHRQIECGLKHVGPVLLTEPSTPAPAASVVDPADLQRQLAVLWNTPPPDAGDAWESEQDRREAGQHEFPFGANLTGPYGPGGDRR
jgi:hypothetical protein